MRLKCKELTTLLASDDSIKAARGKNQRGASKFSYRDAMANVGGDLQEPFDAEDAELKRALEESKRTAQLEEKRRNQDKGDDSELQKALKLSEEDLRKQQLSFLVF